jgi:hypothetical protein
MAEPVTTATATTAAATSTVTAKPVEPASSEPTTPVIAKPAPEPVATPATTATVTKPAVRPSPEPVTPPLVAKSTPPRGVRPLAPSKTTTRPVLTPSTTQSGGPAAVDRGLLTLHAENKSLQSILDDVSTRAGITIQESPEIGKSVVSADFSGTPLDLALRQMLKDYEVALFYAPGQDPGPESLKKVLAYLPNQAPPGQTSSSLTSSAPTSSDAPSAAEWKEKNKALEQDEVPSDDDSASRIAEVDMLIRREGRQAMGVLLNALKSPSSKMRHQALQRALAIGVPIPEETLIEVALNDNSQEVRFVALQALPVDPRLKWVADRAAKDPSVQVSTEAKEILHEYEPGNTASSNQ